MQLCSISLAHSHRLTKRCKNKTGSVPEKKLDKAEN